MSVTQIDTVVIGAGQSGLALSHELLLRDIEHVVLERHARPGDVWRERWESLRLFTPARFDGLADWGFPAPAGSFPTGREFGCYLDGYADRFALPVRTGIDVRKVAPDDGMDAGFVVDTSEGRWHAGRVVVATGACGTPKIPAITAELDPAIRQLHAAQYRCPDDLPQQRILIVGAGTSGTQLGVELATAGRTVMVAGTPPMRVPPFILNHAGTAWFHFLHRVLTRSTPIGRRAAADAIRHGAPLIGIGPNDLDAAGAQRVPRLDGATDGRPRLADGCTLDVDAILWCTGYRMNLDWIDGVPLDGDGLPHHHRGISTDLPGLAFMGLPFQYGLTSALIGGTIRDAVHLADNMSPSPGRSRTASGDRSIS